MDDGKALSRDAALSSINHLLLCAKSTIQKGQLERESLEKSSLSTVDCRRFFHHPVASMYSFHRLICFSKNVRLNFLRSKENMHDLKLFFEVAFYNFQVFLEWNIARRVELSEHEMHIVEQYLSNVEKQLERWQNARNGRRADNLVNLQETMDKELKTHKLEHGPKTQRIPEGDDDEEDVEDIVAEDELMDEVFEVHDQERIDGGPEKLSGVVELKEKEKNEAQVHEKRKPQAPPLCHHWKEEQRNREQAGREHLPS
ncbi:pinin isoform X1 [Canna indica]|uniref:Pinin isoform X1 n=1 Tax=Canna indica TaxID=4628 RepID=A0AAQ3PY04_9LILI|nr:pinin isoform X1 [Canna indica]